MKIDRSILISFLLLVVIGALYRIVPGRPWGFAPQIAMAIFSGSVVKDKKYSFLLPLLSMFVSDVLYEVLYHFNLSTIKGFYDGQVLNYLLFAVLTVIGFWVNKQKVLQIIAGSLAGAVIYFLISNFAVWAGGGLALNNLPYAKTWQGLVECYTAGLLFFKGSIYGTLFFSGLLFGGYYLLAKPAAKATAVNTDPSSFIN